MLRSLEELAFVQRRRGVADKRTRFVTLTSAGKRLFEMAVRACLGTGLIDFAIECIVASKWWSPSAFLEIAQLESRLDHVRGEMFDTATLYYPWHPDD
jgi:DNA-binding MarR family transcriptional regulator